MIYVVLSVRDRCASVYSQPFFASTLEMALRSFRVLINDSSGGLPHTNPEDFDLFHLGSFDDTIGQMANLPGGPVQVALGRDMVKPLPLARS